MKPKFRRFEVMQQINAAHDGILVVIPKGTVLSYTESELSTVFKIHHLLREIKQRRGRVDESSLLRWTVNGIERMFGVKVKFEKRHYGKKTRNTARGNSTLSIDFKDEEKDDNSKRGGVEPTV